MRSDRTAFRAARLRAASALLAYLDGRSEETGTALLAATHDLEAAAARRPPRSDATRERARHLVAAVR